MCACWAINKLSNAPHLPILHNQTKKVNFLLALWKIGAFGSLGKIPTKIVLNVRKQVDVTISALYRAYLILSEFLVQALRSDWLTVL